MSKYDKAVLPDPAFAVNMAELREEWARQAREADKYGSAQEWELTALLLRYFAKQGMKEIDDDILAQRLIQCLEKHVSLPDAGKIARDLIRYIKPWGARVER